MGKRAGAFNGNAHVSTDGPGRADTLANDQERFEEWSPLRFVVFSWQAVAVATHAGYRASMLSRTRNRLLPIVFALISAGPATAQDAVASDAPCELHLWPSDGLNSIYSGVMHGGIVNGAVTRRDGYPPVDASPLATAAQIRLLEEAKPAAAVADLGYTVVVHPNALESRIARATPGRIAASSAPCYAELIVDDVVFRQDWVNGSFLATLFRYRAFGSGAAPTRSFGTWVKTPIRLTPVKAPDEQAAANAEMRNAYVVNLSLFGEALRRPPKSKKR